MKLDFSISAYSTVATTDAVYIIGGYDFICDCYLSTVAKYRNHQWYHVEDLHERRGYHGSITVGEKTMIIGGYSKNYEVSTEVIEFFNGTNSQASNMTTMPTVESANKLWNDTEHCGNDCMYSFPEIYSYEDVQSVLYHGPKMEPKVHWSFATGFGLYEVDSNFCRYETDIVDISTTTTPITTSKLHCTQLI